MKKLFFISSLLTLSLTQAAEYKVLDITANFAAPHMINPSFGINPELSRSWVVNTIVRGEEIENDIIRTKVPGLSYDATTESVVIESEGRLVECANFVQRGRWIFKHKLLQLTDQCRFEKRQIEVLKDDGFETWREKRVHIYLIVD